MDPAQQIIILGSVGGNSGPALLPISSRTFVSDTAGGGSNTWVRTTTVHPTYRRNTGQLVVHFHNWRATSGAGSALGGCTEFGAGAAATAEGAIVTYVDAVTGLLTAVRMVDATTASQTLTAADGSDLVAVTPGSIDMAAAYRFTIDFAGNFPAGMVYRQWAADLTNGDLFQFGNTQILLASTPTNSFASNKAWYGPAEILMASSHDTAALLGDSRCSSINDFANDQWGAIGNWGRLIQKRMPASNAAVPGDTAADFAIAAQSTRRRAIIQRSKYRFNLLGINDCYFSSSAATLVDANNSAIESSLGGTWYRGTLDPVVVSGSNNTVDNSAGDARRQTYNAIIRTKSHYYDVCASNENGSSGTFGSLTYVGADGTHETNTGNENPIGNASALDLIAAIGNPAQVPVVLPYAWNPSNKASTVTLSNSNFTAVGSSTSPQPVVLGVTGATSGKYFFSIKTSGTPINSQAVMIAGNGFILTSTLAGTTNIEVSGDGNIYGNGAQLGGGLGAWASADVIDIAVDFGAALLWARKNGGNWNNSGTANPATGVGGISISYMAGGTFFPGDVPWPSTTHTVNFGLIPYTYPAPATFINLVR